MQEPRFRADLYAGASADYERYRPAYPAELLRDLLRRANVHDGGRLLDLACGTGQVAFPLSARFTEVWAVDQEPDVVALARAKAERARVPHVRWTVERAEDLMVADGRFDLITVGNAFHRLHRDTVARNAYRWLRPSGCIALLWADSPWTGRAEWQRIASGVVRKWVDRTGAADRIPDGLDAAIERRPHATVLADAGFAIVGKFEFCAPHAWTVETLAGFAYSTSLLSRAVLGANAPAFASELGHELSALGPTGRFEHELSFAYELAIRPATS